MEVPNQGLSCKRQLTGVEERFFVTAADAATLDQLSELGGGLFLPAGEVKATRRRATAALLAAREAAKEEATAERANAIDDEEALSALLGEFDLGLRTERRRRPRGGAAAGNPKPDAEAARREWRGEAPPPFELTVLCRTAAQAAAAAAMPYVREIGLDFLEVG